MSKAVRACRENDCEPPFRGKLVGRSEEHLVDLFSSTMIRGERVRGRLRVENKVASRLPYGEDPPSSDLER